MEFSRRGFPKTGAGRRACRWALLAPGLVEIKELRFVDAHLAPWAVSALHAVADAPHAPFSPTEAWCETAVCAEVGREHFM